MDSGRIAYLRQSLHAFRGAFDTHTGDDLARRAWLYLKCIERTTLLRRFGENADAPPLDYMTIWGIEQVLGETPDSQEGALRSQVQQLANLVKQSEDADSIPPEVIDEIVEVWHGRLDMTCWLQHFERNPQETVGDPYNFKAKFKNILQSYVATQHLLPPPEPVAERLRALSRELFLEGSPLTPWWRVESDMEILLRAVEKPALLAEDKTTDWERAPEALKRWDMAPILRGIESEAAGATTPETTAGEEARMLVPLFLLAVGACHQVRAFRPVGKMDADEPVEVEAGFVAVGAVKWKCLIEDQGLDKEFWHLRIRPSRALLTTRTGGRILRHLVVSLKGSGDILCESRKEKGTWQVRLPLRKIKGLSQILDLPPDLAKEALAAIKKEALTSFFDWTLDS